MMNASRINQLRYWVASFRYNDATQLWTASLFPQFTGQAHSFQELAEMLQQHAAREITLLVCEALSVDVDEIFTRTRKREIADARFIAAWIMYLNFSYTQDFIAGFFTWTTHCAVVNAIKQVNNVADLHRKLSTVLSRFQFLKNEPEKTVSYAEIGD